MRIGIFTLALFLNIFNNLIAQDVLNKVPVRDYNSIDSISISKIEVVYHSNSGKLVYNIKDNTYTIDTVSNKFEKRKGSYVNSTDFPSEIRSVVGGSYQKLYDSLTIGKYGKYLLFNVAGEGAVYSTQCLVDKKSRTAYKFKDASFRCFSTDDSTISIAGYNGITKINKKNHTILSKIVLPIFNESTSYYEENKNIWLATDKLFIQKINKSDSSLIFWDPSTIVGSQISNPYYTNIIESEKYIIMGCRGTNQYQMINKNESYLLLYSKKEKEWKYLNANHLKGLEKLYLKDNTVYIGGHHIVEWEGGGRKVSGGFGYYILGKDYIKIIKEITSKEVVTDINEKLNGLEIETFLPIFEKELVKKHLFDLDLKTIVETKSSRIELRDLYGKKSIIPNHRKHKKHFNENRKRLNKFLVKPKILLKYHEDGYFSTIKY